MIFISRMESKFDTLLLTLLPLPIIFYALFIRKAYLHEKLGTWDPWIRHWFFVFLSCARYCSSLFLPSLSSVFCVLFFRPRLCDFLSSEEVKKAKKERYLLETQRDTFVTQKLKNTCVNPMYRQGLCLRWQITRVCGCPFFLFFYRCALFSQQF